MNLFLLFFLYNWMPPVLQQAGMPLQQALIATVLFNLGGVVGGIALGQLADKVGTFPVLLGALLRRGGSPGLGRIPRWGRAGDHGRDSPRRLLLHRAQTTANPLTAGLYPTLMRGTGLGWAFGVARFGTIFGPIVGGVFMSMAGAYANFSGRHRAADLRGPRVLVLKRVVSTDRSQYSKSEHAGLHARRTASSRSFPDDTNAAGRDPGARSGDLRR